MADNSQIRAQFGLTQAEMARLLGIGYSQYTMFESGKRSLPHAAQLLLTEFVTWLQSPAKASNRKLDAGRVAERTRFLTRLLEENRYRQLKVARRIEVVTRKQERATRMEVLSGYLKTRGEDSHTNEKLTLATITSRAFGNQRNDPDTEQMRLSIKLRLLEVEAAFLESELNGTTGSGIDPKKV